MTNNTTNNVNDEEKNERDTMVDEKEIETPNGVPASRLEELRDRGKLFFSHRRNVVLFLLCLCIFILCIILIAVAISWGTYTLPAPKDCRTPECLMAASAVVLRSNMTKFEPCNQFWAYSCSGWQSRYSLPKNSGSYSVTDQLKQKINAQIRNAIDLVPHDLDIAAPERKVKSFYDSCRDLKEIEHWMPKKIRQDIHEVGGWALINDSPSQLWRRNDVLKKLQVGYGVEPFFKVVVEPDDRNPMQTIIKLMPSGLGLPAPSYYAKPQDDKYIQAYKDFIMNTVQTMNVNLFEARRFSEEIFSYERRIAEITPHSGNLRNTVSTYRVLTLQELDRLSYSISWTEIIQGFFPNFVTSTTKVAVLSMEYFQRVSEIISSTDDNVLNNYYMWRFMHTFAPHSSSKFRLVENKFQHTFEGIKDLSLNAESNWEECIEVTSKYLGHAIGAMYIDHYFPQAKLDKVNNYLHKLVGTLNVVAGDLPWLKDESVREQAQMKIRSLGVLSGYPSFIRNHTLEYYKDLKVQTEYFQNIKDGIYFLHKKQEEMLLKNKAASDYSWTIYSHDTKAEYKYAGNQLVVPAGIFESPLFDLESPLAMKYGVLAAHVANKMAELLDDKGINYDAYGTLQSWMTNRSMESFMEKQECLMDAIENVTLHGVEVKPKVVISSLVSDIAGVKIAYEAYKRHAEEEKESAVLPGVDVTNKQLFFISYAQSLCTIINPEKLMSSQEASTHLPEELRVLTTLQQLPEFSSAFNCPVSSVMNRKQKCRMW